MHERLKPESTELLVITGRYYAVTEADGVHYLMRWDYDPSKPLESDEGVVVATFASPEAGQAFADWLADAGLSLVEAGEPH